MPYTYSSERVLATVDWAHAELRERKKSSGYAMDSLFKNYSKGAHRPGKFARYLRGDNSPNHDFLNELMLDNDGQSFERMQLPLYEVLRLGHMRFRDGNPDDRVLFDIGLRLDFRLIRYWENGAFEAIEITPASALKLATYANSYALAALLMWASSQQMIATEEVPESRACLVIGQRAFQCLILTMASGEFPQTGPVLTARIRQRVLDQLSWQGHRLDTASVDLAAAVEVGRSMVAAARGQSSSSKQRGVLSKLLRNADSPDIEAITPKIVPQEQADAAHARHPVKLVFREAPIGKANLVSGYGSKASTQLRIDLGDYLSDE